MLEAVNSSLSNAPFLRLNAEQTSSATAIAADVSLASAPQAPYVSPYVYVDNNYDTAVLQIRDSDTGDVLQQYPSPEALESRQRENQSQAQRETVSQLTGGAETQSSPSQRSSVSRATYVTAQQIASDTTVSTASAPSASVPAAAPAPTAAPVQSTAAASTVSVDA